MNEIKIPAQGAKIVHNETCSMAFGKPSKHELCPRCQQLKAGHAPRAGWNSMRKQAEAQQIAAIEAHFAPGGRYQQLKAAGLEFTDTAFQW